MKTILCLTVALTSLIPQQLRAQTYTFTPVPEWVVNMDIPSESSVSKYDVLSGYYLTLADYQINLDEEAVFNHEVINVSSYGGITNASQLSILYDTNYQKLYIHYLYIWRKGKKIDRTSDLSLEIMNHEQLLNQGIYTGQITAYDILNDIRKDDMIDFAYTLVGDNPIFEGEKYLFIPLEQLNPVDLFSVRILYSKDKDYIYKCVDCDSLRFTALVEGNYNLIEMIHENAKPIHMEDFTPSWCITYKHFILSSMSSWVDVNTWAQKVFHLDKEPILDPVFNEIFSGEETMEEKINKIIDYVQNDIRYMGIESGIGSIQPFPPEQVVKQRFGDCKDKSLLLVSLLKSIGIEQSYPALVNTNIQHEVENLFPSNQVFNHCIVRFDFTDSSYWVDPSFAQQGGDFRNLYSIDYGKALIIGIPADTLNLMSPRRTESGTDITEEFTITSFTEPAALTITSTRFGFDADQRRTVMELYTTKDITEFVAKDLGTLFPKIEKTEEVQISDDIENNQFMVTYHYTVGDFWIDGDKGTNEAAKGHWIFRFEPVLLYDYLKVKVCDERKSDFLLFHPTNLRYRVIFHFPKDLLVLDDFKVVDNRAYRFTEKVEQTGRNTLQIDYSLETKSKSITAESSKRSAFSRIRSPKAFP